ncbi:hypothetical protein [Desulfomonile tiedjei]|uniref:Late embryogenesis abundant protein LEA-2 subgroup domain-containing protein n=1 Tax=Desulfomonile tiedjei (strain ATCC 49306 / DSM 6799 / DCB-1) TaxID=706587 RepID=I4C7L5_DESTA|nr:hypothetical protein [Desulfomonile tiedjei]AFM25556.1 hypothetical protein Desti_2887 [Desulfomonile tiedjei DSM 6799]
MIKCLTVFGLFVALFGFAVLPATAFENPKITLDRVEVASIQPFFAKPRVGYKDEKDTGKDLPVGSILNMAYIFNIKNPNKEPVMLDEMTFTVSFDGFDVNTAFAYEDSWIPAGKTNQLKVVVTNEALPTISSLMVGAGNVSRIQEMKTSAGALAKKWWETVGDFDFPITVSGGTALFKDAKDKEHQVTFSGKWENPEKPKK